MKSLSLWLACLLWAHDSDIKVWAWRKLTGHDDVWGRGMLTETPVLRADHFSTPPPPKKTKTNQKILKYIQFIISPAIQDPKRSYSHHFIETNSTCGCSLLLSASRRQKRSQFLKRGFFGKDFYEINFIPVRLSETGTLNNPETLRQVYASLYCGRGRWACEMWKQPSLNCAAKLQPLLFC